MSLNVCFIRNISRSDFTSTHQVYGGGLMGVPHPRQRKILGRKLETGVLFSLAPSLTRVLQSVSHRFGHRCPHFLTREVDWPVLRGHLRGRSAGSWPASGRWHSCADEGAQLLCLTSLPFLIPAFDDQEPRLLAARSAVWSRECHAASAIPVSCE